jgi:TRAP-type C4-dicarboxylate transport system substrate-binding protein
MRRKLCGGIFAICLALVFVVGTAFSVQADTVEWKWFTYFPAVDSVTQSFQKFAGELEKETNGQFKITVFSAGELPYKGQDVPRITMGNQVQLGDTAVGYIAGEMPAINIYGVPFVCTSFDEFFNSIGAAKPIIEKAIMEKTKLGVLFHWTMPSQNIWTVKPVKSLADLQGKKIRIWNPLQGVMLKALGATPVSIASAEVPTALQRGVADGAITSALSVRDWKLYDYVNYGYMVSFQMAPNVIVMNMKMFHELPVDLQTLLLIKGKEWEARMREFSEAMDAQTGKDLESHGVTLIKPTPAEFMEAAKAMHPMWADWTDKHGPVAEALMDKITTTLGKK